MLPILETLELEDREIFWQVMTEALEQMTPMQRQCLMMSILGMDQTVIGRIIGVNNKAVSYHFNNALDKVKEVSTKIL